MKMAPSLWHVLGCGQSAMCHGVGGRGPESHSHDAECVGVKVGRQILHKNNIFFLIFLCVSMCFANF